MSSHTLEPPGAGLFHETLCSMAGGSLDKTFYLGRTITKDPGDMSARPAMEDPEELRGALDQFFEHFHKHIFHPVVHRLEALATREDASYLQKDGVQMQYNAAG
ncbi:unnamed protein product [Symbiodinium pilosum]|uniref:Uncharacterized protein n=1 Tax=Symbiodinium pilosum TaxID=2952 RepID=A0A812QLN0_SYMPI|nr:unnamed protein product [Symbiodinium pilosum]